MDTQSNQQAWIERARNVLPAGGFGNFDPGIVISHGKGARVWDEDGNEFIARRLFVHEATYGDGVQPAREDS